MTDVLRWMPVRLCMATLRRRLLVLLTVLLLAQTLGVLHRVAHARGDALHSATTSASVSDKANALTSLWGEHSSLADCRLFDQACSDVLHLSLFSAVVVNAPHVWQVASCPERFSLFERFYAARGPPALS